MQWVKKVQLTGQISLPGRYLVLILTLNKGILKQIKKENVWTELSEK